MQPLEKLLQVMDRLLAPDGCPWDREQTHESLCKYLLEESHEAIEAINNSDMNALKDELGDVLLQVVFHAKIAEAASEFTIDDIINNLIAKLIRRHSHVFGDDKAQTAAEVLQIWENNKKKEKTVPNDCHL